MKKLNPYLQKVHSVIPRLLSLYDTNPVNSTCGMGDRYRWAWKLIDFSNGTFQGAANGLARLTVSGLLPGCIAEQALMQRIDDMFKGTDAVRRPNGSMEEAFPYESSFCVTALVAYDLLTALELLVDRIDERTRGKYLNIIHPMILFLHRADESHAFISNHLATAAAALYKWSAITGDKDNKRGLAILKRVLNAQSGEGWFREYEGADPGYQTLCTYYLADLHQMNPDLGLIQPLRKSIQFLSYFAHPDGSFGGYYGSRNTRFYYPAGIEALSREIPEAASLAAFMRLSIVDNKVITLDVMDEPNLVPMFNSYCWAAVLFEKDAGGSDNPTVPCKSSHLWRKHFKEAGLLVDKGRSHYTIISYHKGGVCYHYVKDRPEKIDTGVVVRSAKGRYCSTQAYQKDNQVKLSENEIAIISTFTEIHRQVPSPFQFIVLRIIAVTIMRSRSLGNFIKRVLVKLLITGKKTIPVKNERKIIFGENLQIVDNTINAERCVRVDLHKPFSAIHMASSGYWQRQDDAE